MKEETNAESQAFLTYFWFRVLTTANNAVYCEPFYVFSFLHGLNDSVLQAEHGCSTTFETLQVAEARQINVSRDSPAYLFLIFFPNGQ